MRILFGEMAAVVLESQRVLPRAAVSGGFHFRFPDLGPALSDLLA
jgi:NAD dependent epimerase/dehydratase family enzyme